MSDFEFFFSFYGLILGLSVAEIASGIARTVHERGEVKVGWLTPMLAVFIALDVAGFWAVAWQDWRRIDFGFGILVVGMVMAMTYYVAASVVFPRDFSGWASLDEHFWARRRLVFGIILSINLIAATGTVWAWQAADRAYPFPMNWISWSYFVLVVLACVVPRGRWMYLILGLLILYFLNWLPQFNPLVAAVEAKLRAP
ncbi:hypothetical protein [Phenylobacterium sp.]|jgi:hypothetical protein|uniref:hypothetical protein n=1 Tax=Phenylobacterium sp. TaxID=1871053 RepID=UPI0037C5CBFD